MSDRWLDLVDPTREELHSTLPAHVDPEVVEVLASRSGGRPRPTIEGHGSYAFGVLLAAQAEPEAGGVEYLEVDFVATPDLLVTVRKSPPDGSPFVPEALHPAASGGEPPGVLVQRLVDDVADSYLTALDARYAAIEELEDAIEDIPTADVRERVYELRHGLVHARRTVSATRAAVRRILDGRVEVGDHALFPPAVEQRFADTYETLVRVTEELDIARDLVAGARDHHQSKVAESQGEVAKKLTVIASLVLVPSLIVGFYGQNFDGEFGKGFWTLAFSSGLIVLSTIVQLALFRWRRWI